MLAEKKMLTLEDLESQTALELPNREQMALVTVVLITGDILEITVRNVDIGANICANLLSSGAAVECTVTQ